MEAQQKSPDQAPQAEEFIIVLITTATEEEAHKIGRALVEKRLIACANILPLKKSIFHWEGKVSEQQECLMLLKSRRVLFEQLSTAVKQLHSYQVPEIVAIPLIMGSTDYLNWLMASTHK